ncbi:hypothetical protein N866_18605 [Actinotalea ferrariae CF5-4]|uniref:Uncharacterized protein n=1 Tax=Actinotalea ferrariae CF5-4 TaxID=948458 RepID=A0A021VUJ5_9CELL|nr:hypothetical protein [Actinotalea ferrariae]EYR63725.1 hypothetical protein N866_18605 [Actinotalea ferrariae CF5-4]
MPAPADEHWAPQRIILGRRPFDHAGVLLVERDQYGQVLTQAPLEGMAAVEHRYPVWAQGPFGRVEPERRLPGRPGVFALVQDGTPRYVGGSTDLARTFSPRGLGEISRRDAQRSTSEEACRLNRLVVAEALRGRAVDLYVLTVRGPGRLGALLGAAPDEDPYAVAEEVAAQHRGAWQLPA